MPLAAIALPIVLSSCASQRDDENTFYPCPALAAVGPTLVYPIPGATGVPTTASSLIFTSLPTLSDVTTSLDPTVATSGAVALSLGAFVVAPSPIPSPAASFVPATKLYGVAYPALAPKNDVRH